MVPKTEPTPSFSRILIRDGVVACLYGAKNRASRSDYPNFNARSRSVTRSCCTSKRMASGKSGKGHHDEATQGNSFSIVHPSTGVYDIPIRSCQSYLGWCRFRQEKISRFFNIGVQKAASKKYHQSSSPSTVLSFCLQCFTPPAFFLRKKVAMLQGF